MILLLFLDFILSIDNFVIGFLDDSVIEFSDNSIVRFYFFYDSVICGMFINHDR